MTSAVLVLVTTGLVLGLVIGLVVKFFGAEPDARLEAVEELLPGANCGGCGLAGCADFARAVVAGDATPEQCPSNSSSAVATICELLGIAAGERASLTAVVCCGGDNAVAAMAAEYNGVLDCKAAMQVAGGAKGCRYGCLGFGTCANACPFGAIEMTARGLAVVHADLCTGCGQCVKACPRGLIKLVPVTAPVHVFCNSPEKGGAKRKVCQAACIGCRKCLKQAEEGQMTMNGFLAEVNYDDPPPAGIADVCPTKCLRAKPAAAEPATESEEREVVNG